MRGVYAGGEADHPAGMALDGRRPDEARHLIVQEKLHALGPGAGLQGTHQPRATTAAGTAEPGAVGPEGVILAWRRVARAVRPDIVRRDLFKLRRHWPREIHTCRRNDRRKPA